MSGFLRWFWGRLLPVWAHKWLIFPIHADPNGCTPRHSTWYSQMISTTTASPKFWIWLNRIRWHQGVVKSNALAERRTCIVTILIISYGGLRNPIQRLRHRANDFSHATLVLHTAAELELLWGRHLMWLYAGHPATHWFAPWTERLIVQILSVLVSLAHQCI